ncbi:radical SAM protein [Sulfitobacter sp. F26204]|uniref:radical SAM protein n=1 Tax=Sulfitobacter sp. F26204 TaxID=2996014 RepID=UPI00225DEE91|nr:radical SAM protein [Sulfitobacter sp. F26204]MCX7559840.1 radical SAM protein [Sulfitobacter sp. F26204]
MKDLDRGTDANIGKFQDPMLTAQGDARATVALRNPQTLWFNTGTLCNIECVNCYIASSPTNDALAYISADEVRVYLDQIEMRAWPVTEIAFTGGEPFMNPEMIAIAEAALSRGYEVLILTNAMRPMMRKPMQAGLLRLNAHYPDKLTLRISVDHHRAELHDTERGAGAFEKTLTGMKWLRDNGIRMAVAGRSVFGDSEAESRAGYGAFYQKHKFDIDPDNPGMTVLFPEMDESVEVPEITTACWDILNKSPDTVMCAFSRMVVKRKGADRPAVLACTLLPYAPEFELGTTLEEAERDVALNHPHCAKFCVLGGASCSV